LFGGRRLANILGDLDFLTEVGRRDSGTFFNGELGTLGLLGVVVVRVSRLANLNEFKTGRAGGLRLRTETFSVFTLSSVNGV
jgi:hypothetical protein